MRLPYSVWNACVAGVNDPGYSCAKVRQLAMTSLGSSYFGPQFKIRSLLFREQQRVRSLVREIFPASPPGRVPMFVECNERSLHALRLDRENALRVLPGERLRRQPLDRDQQKGT